MTGPRPLRPLPSRPRPGLRPAGFALACSLAAGALAFASAGAHAQGATDSTSAPAVAVTSVEDANPALSLVPLRPQTEIAASVSAARADVSAVDAELAPARQRAVLAKGRLAIQKEELETIQTRQKVAKQAKQEAEVATLKTQAELKKREIAYLTRTEDAELADVNRLEAERDAANARVAMYERELELAMLRTSPNVTGADPRLTDLVKRTLEAQKTAADKAADAAARAKALAERQLTQLKALGKLSAPVK